MVDACLAVLRTQGLLLQSDSTLPSVATIVAGEPIHGSWWTHTAARAIYETVQRLGHDPDLALVKLIAGKDTFVHRRLWPQLYALGTSGHPWQRAGLSRAAEMLERELLEAGQLQTTGALAKELQVRLLAYCEQFHTAAGSHATQLESWPHWAQRLRLDFAPVSPDEAVAAMEAIHPAALFPWSPRMRTHTRIPKNPPSPTFRRTTK